MFVNLNIPAMVAARPVTDGTPSHLDPANVRVLRADEVRDGDTVLAGIDRRPTGFDVDWFGAEYVAHPRPFDPTCTCGMCDLADTSTGAYVVLTDEFLHAGPSVTCDPWEADRLVLIVPAT